MTTTQLIAYMKESQDHIRKCGDVIRGVSKETTQNPFNAWEDIKDFAKGFGAKTT